MDKENIELSTQMNKQSSSDVQYAHYIRSFAAIAVIVMHSVGENLQKFNPTDPYQNQWLSANFYYSLLRWASPFFIMISGAFLLNPKKNETIKDFLTKRFRRVFIPFLFWAVVYTLYENRGFIDQWKAPIWSKVFQKMIFEDVYYHLWFISMILSLYFLTPIFRVFIRHATRFEIEYFLVFTFFITTVQHFIPNVFMIKYVGWLGYIGFYVMGYYISTFNIGKKKLIYVFGLLMPLITFFAAQYLAEVKGSYDDKVFVYFSPNVVLISFAFYLYLKNYDWTSFSEKYPKLDSAIHYFSNISFGIYFIHVLIIDLLKNFLWGNSKITSDQFIYWAINPLIGTLLQSFTVLILSISSIYILSKIPILKKVIL